MQGESPKGQWAMELETMLVKEKIDTLLKTFSDQGRENYIIYNQLQ